MFNIQLFADSSTSITDVARIPHLAKLASRTAYLLNQKMDADAGGFSIATDDAVLAMLNQNLPNPNNLAVNPNSFTLEVGMHSDVSVTRLGDGIISVSNTTLIDGFSFSISDTTISFTNNSATEGTAIFNVNVAATDIFNPSSAQVSITGSNVG